MNSKFVSVATAAIMTMAAGSANAEPQAEVLHWWT